MQLSLFGETQARWREPFTDQLLKWVGNKQRFAHEIVSYFPAQFGAYIEPFLGSGAVLGTLAPARGIGADAFGPLIEIWQTLRRDPELLKRWYAERWEAMMRGDKVEEYERTILYGAQDFDLERLFEVIGQAKSRGVYVALSIDGTKRSGDLVCDLPIPDGLFEREIRVNCGRSMLKRFQMEGQELAGEVVADRLLLTYRE